jgi:hypothetical protein
MQIGTQPRSRQGRRLRKAEQRLGDDLNPRGREARSLSAPRGGPTHQGVSQRSSSAPRTRPARSKRRSGQRREGRIESSASSENEASAQVGPWAASYEDFANLDAGLGFAVSPSPWDAVGLGAENGTVHGPVPLLRQGRSLHRKTAESLRRKEEGLGQGWCNGLDGIIGERCFPEGRLEGRDVVERTRATHVRGEERNWFAPARAGILPGASRNPDGVDADKGFDPIPVSAMLQTSTAPKLTRYHPPSSF